jgi:hypothetical protein
LAIVYDSSAATASTYGSVHYASSTTVSIQKDDGDGTFSTVNATAPITFATGDYVWVIAKSMPMTDWLG